MQEQSKQVDLFRPDYKTMYEALVNRDSQFEGIFVVGVKTTGIFCRPTCSARKPKFENVEFFSGSKEALDYGYRPCKVCNPMKNYGENPEWVTTLLRCVQENPTKKFKDQDLREMGLQPEKVRRWFLKFHGMTFHAYTRSLRINEAFKQLKAGKRITDLAHDNGYESLSGFTSTFKNTLGHSPQNSISRHVITVNRIPTPLGPMLVASTDSAICLLEFTDRKMLETQLKVLQKRYDSILVPGNNQIIELLVEELDLYFKGNLRNFTCPIDYKGSDFQMTVWNQLLNIPYGETWSYGKLSRAINNEKAVRAVGRANGENRIAIIIPCHRVIGADGSLTGYGGGIWRKQHLLHLEAKGIAL